MVLRERAESKIIDGVVGIKVTVMTVGDTTFLFLILINFSTFQMPKTSV